MDWVNSGLMDAGVDIGAIGKTLLTALLIAIVGWLVGGWLRRRVQRTLSVRAFGRNGAVLIGRLISISVFVITMATILGVLGVNSTGLLTFLGAFTVALGLSLQDVFKNFFSGVVLLMERPFRVGDFIRIRDYEGEVLGIDVRTTQLRIHDGSIVMIPNSVMFTDVLTNRSRAGWQRLDLTINADGLDVESTERLVHQALGTFPSVARPIASPVVASASAGATALEISLLVERSPRGAQDVVAALVAATDDGSITVTQR